jgi:hypothetical protein
MQVHCHNLGGQHFSQLDVVQATHQKDVAMLKSAARLLWKFQGFEGPTIEELELAIDWLVLRLSLVRHIFAGHKVDLQRIEFGPQELSQ